jgi:enoyl-CoA hydratase/carnithine racemase
MFETVNYRVIEGVAKITLNRPQRLNAINETLLRDLLSALQKANGDECVRAIVLEGAGRAFCAGDDLKEFDQQAKDRSSATVYVESIQDISRAMLFNEKIIIGSIHGWAVGGGLEWVINCDLVVSDEDARFFFPEISLGLIVTGGVTALLPRMIGLERAKRLMLLGQRFNANEAKELGFDWKIVGSGEREDVAMDLATKIRDLPQSPVRQLKRALAVTPYSDLQTALGIETAAVVDGFLDPASLERARQRVS